MILLLKYLLVRTGFEYQFQLFCHIIRRIAGTGGNAGDMACRDWSKQEKTDTTTGSWTKTLTFLMWLVNHTSSSTSLRATT